MPELFANNASSTLDSSILAGDLSLTVATGEGALFPAPSGGDYFHITLDDGVNVEIVRVTARSGDVLTIVRGQQGTVAAGFAAGTPVQLRLTAGTLTRFEASRGIRGIRGFSLSNYLERAAGGDLDGNATPGFEIYGVVIVDDINRGALVVSGYIASTAAEFVGPGYHLWFEGTRPKHTITDGSSNFLSNFVQEWLLGVTFKKGLIPISMGFNGTTRFLKLGGQTLFSAAMTGYTPSTNPFRVGRPGGSATSGGMETATLVGLAAKTDGVLSDSEHEEILRTFLAQGDLPDSSFTSRWSFADLSLGAVSSTLEDAIGSNDLTLVGSLSVVDDRYAGLVLNGDPAATSVKVGGQIGGSTTSPDIRGARETSGPTLLTYGAIRDTELFARDGATIVGFPRRITGLTNFATGAAAGDRDYYERSGGDPLASQTQWTLSAAFGTRVEHGDLRRIVSTAGEFLTGGAAIAYDGISVTFYWVDSGAVLRQLTVVPQEQAARVIHAIAHFNDGVGTLWVAGTFGDTATHATGAYTSGTGFAVGGSVGGAGASNAAEESLIYGAAFHLDTMSNDLALAWYRACLDAGRFVPDPQMPASQEAWAVVAGSNPNGGAWTPVDGANNLVRTGSAATLTELAVPIRW
jgi:hypothetical protein